MESSLHRDLKFRYAAPGGDSIEFRQGPFVADAIGPDGAWIEIQCSPLGSLGGKLGHLLDADHAVRVVKPVVLTRRIVRTTASNSGRLSPNRGRLIDVFDELVHVMRHFPHDRLTIEVVGVHVEEVRMPRRRRPGYVVTDRRLREVGPSVTLRTPADLWALLPTDGPDLPEAFTTLDLDRQLGRGQPFAQRVAYCLRLSGAVQTVGLRARRRLYQRPDRCETARQSAPLLVPQGRPTIEAIPATISAPRQRALAGHPG